LGSSRSEAAFAILGILVASAFVVTILVLLFAAAQGPTQGHHSADANATASPSTHHATSGDDQEAGHPRASGRDVVVVLGLAVPALYLVLIASWAALRRRWAFLLRHTVCATAMWLLVLLYLASRGTADYNKHDWNRSFADASVILFAVTLGIGPLVRLWRMASPALAWRRETGIWAFIAAAAHVAIFWKASYDWSGWRNFFYPGADGHNTTESLTGDAATGAAPTAFGPANVVGLVAIAYALVLTLTSNDASQRWLKSGWSWLMKHATTMQLLVLLHTWLFAYYLLHESLLAVGTLWAAFWSVLLLQSLAFTKTVWFRRRPPAVAETGT
jgi:methionine sulfoxide reductase heme-binding subunit